MKKFYFLLSLLMLLTISTNSVWGETYTLGWGNATSDDGSFTNFTATSGTVNNIVSFSTAKESSSTAPAYNSSSKELRLYYNANGDGGSITLTPAEGVTITGFLMLTSTTPTVKYSVDGGTATAVSANTTNKTYTVTNISASSSLKIQNVNTSNTQLRISKIQITYTKSGGANPVAVTGVSLDETTLSLEVGETQQLTPTIIPSNATNANVSWSSNNNSVATVVDGVVTAVAVGNATITVATEDGNKTATCNVTVTAVTPKITITATSSGITTSYADGTFEQGGVTFSYIQWMKSTNFIQAKKSTTNSLKNTTAIPGIIKSITVVTGEGKDARAVTVKGGATADNLSTITAPSTNMTMVFDFGSNEYSYFQLNTPGNACYFDKIVIAYEEVAPAAVAKPRISGENNFFASTEVTMTCETESAVIYYTTDETAGAGDPYTSAPWVIYNSENKPSFDATTTVYVAAKKGDDWSEKASATFTKATIMTVAQALVASTAENQYVTGTITDITEVNTGYGNATYVISDLADGIAVNTMIVYRGKYLNNASFTSSDQLHVGDVVVVKGNITQYNSKNQLGQDNILMSISAPAIAAPTFTPDGGGFVVSTDVTIACSTANSSVYYTIDETNPTKSSTAFSTAIPLTATTTIKAIAYVGNESSMVVEKTFTLTAPKTVEEACADLDNSSPIANVAVEGVVYNVASIANGNATYWISDDGTEGDNVLQVYNGKGLNGADIAEGGVRVGDKVIVFGKLKTYTSGQSTIKEFDTGSRILSLIRKTITGLAVSGTPTKTSYKTGEEFDPSGLTVTVTFNDNSHATVAVADCSWDITPVAFTEAGTGKSVSVKATYEEVQSAVYEVTGLTVIDVPNFNNSAYEWQLVSSNEQLVADKYYVIGSVAGGKTASYASGNIMTAVATTFTDACISAANRTTAGSTVFKLGGNSSAWTFEEVENNKLLGGTTGNNMTWDSNTEWTIAITNDNNATITNKTDGVGVLQYNSGSPRFKVYTSTQAVIQLYVWAPVIHKLRYDANGGEDAPATQVADGEGKATVTSATPTPPSGKVLDKWNTEANGSGDDKVAGDVIDLSNADVTLYAQWREPGTYTLSYNANGGSLIEGKSAIEPADVIEGTTVTAAEAIFEKEGFLFAGWQFEENIYDEGQNFTMPGKNVVLSAQWNTLNISEYTLVTSIDQLQDGDKIVIVAAGSNAAMGAQNGSIRYSISVGKTTDKTRLVLKEDNPVELTLGNGSNGKYTLKEDNKYFYSTSAKNVGTRDESFEWTITINDDGTTVDAGTAGKLQYNYNNGNPRFTTYTSNQSPVVIFKKANTKRETVFGRYGTVCMPNGGIVNGATLFEVAHRDAEKIYFDEVLDGVMIAGRPYIFKANKGMTSFTILYTDELNAAAGNYNGLIGYIGASSEDKMTLPTNGDYYILSNNQYRQVLGGTAYVLSNRAYIKLSEVPNEESVPAPGRRRVAMGYSGTNVTTGIDDLNVSNSQTATKVLLDGQLLIIREGRMYDITGSLVK